jgi:hypothetical protein
VRHFFTRRTPPFTRVLLIESGSRRLLDSLVPSLYQFYGDSLEIDLVTCFAGIPEGFRGSVYRVADYSGRVGRKRLYAELTARDYPIVGIICSGESIMTKWKWALAARIPAKVFALNENGDYFFIDWSHWRVMLHFALFRAGLTGAAAIPTIARLVFFPFSLGFLLGYAGFVHLRRRLRSRIIS